jgi:hypothetical protein
MKSLDQFDPLPKLGAKVQTEVVYYHQEEKEVKPHLYEKDGKLRYAPPLVSVATGQAGTLYEWITYGQEVTVADGQTFTFSPGFWKAVEEEKPKDQLAHAVAKLAALGKMLEEEKQDNKLDVSHGHAYFTDSAGNDIARPIDAEGWISHTPGDPMPCDPGLGVKVKLHDDDQYPASDVDEVEVAGILDWSDEVGSKIIAWKPA